MTSARRDNLFVVGCQRSGTSVVWAGLTAHPDLAPLAGYNVKTGYDPKELYYFRNIFEARRRFPSPMYGWDVDQEYLRRQIELAIEYCVEKHGSKTGRFVNAHPRDGVYLAELLEVMPEARIVCVLRHAQEVVWSALHAPWSKPSDIRDPKVIRKIARNWGEHAQIAKGVIEGEFGKAVLLVRHEELIESPANAAGALAQHACVSEHPAIEEMLGAPTFNSSFRNSVPAYEMILETRRSISRAIDFRRIVYDEIGLEMEAVGYLDLGNPPLVSRSIRISDVSAGS